MISSDLPRSRLISSDLVRSRPISDEQVQAGKADRHWAYVLATALGAKVAAKTGDGVTHVVAARQLASHAAPPCPRTATPLPPWPI